METLTWRHMVVIEDYDHMETMDEKCEVDETNTFVVNFFSNP